jgi:hypothetical protein
MTQGMTMMEMSMDKKMTNDKGRKGSVVIGNYEMGCRGWRPLRSRTVINYDRQSPLSFHAYPQMRGTAGNGYWLL